MRNRFLFICLLAASAGCGDDDPTHGAAPVAGKHGSAGGGSKPNDPSAANGDGEANSAQAGSKALAAGSGGRNEPASSAGSATAGTAANAGAAGATAASGDWTTLVQGAWELPAGQEGYRCVRLTVKEDTYVKEFQPIAPLGTHHTLLSVNEMPTAADGVAVCTAGDNGHTTLLGSGVGENYSAGPLPDGVAYKVPKGHQLNLNLHLFNTSDKVLKGVSGTKVRTTSADKVTQFAETILAGPIALSIPQGRTSTMGVCTVKSDTTVFAVSPHMHQLGVHLKAVANRAGKEPVTLYDDAYDFYEQRQYPANQLALKAGDTVQVECTYQNDTTRTVMFGESSLDEMCFLGLYRYPVAGEGLICRR